VDALTSMLVQSMESSGDPEFFGESNHRVRPLTLRLWLKII